MVSLRWVGSSVRGNSVFVAVCRDGIFFFFFLTVLFFKLVFKEILF